MELDQRTNFVSVPLQLQLTEKAKVLFFEKEAAELLSRLDDLRIIARRAGFRRGSNGDKDESQDAEDTHGGKCKWGS